MQSQSFRKGTIWADPSVEHLRELMQRAVDDAALRAGLGKAARDHVKQRFLPEMVSRVARSRLQEIAAAL